MNDSTLDRRAFLRHAGRFAAAGGLAGGCALLVLTGRDCPRPIVCGNCGALPSCAFPRAVKWRDERSQPESPQSPRPEGGTHA